MSRVGPTTWGAPILVTGMPRSGTTWVARLLATAPGAALAGREPLNPRGRQYALAGTLDGWTRLTYPTPRQARALRLAYCGLTPWVYSRYGRHQWRAPLPWARLVVKDPFAVLSIPAVSSTTGARAVLVHRHPGACLVSYRRMGWRPDVAELTPLLEAALDDRDVLPAGVTPSPESADEVAAMAWFWNVLYGLALHDVAGDGQSIVVNHEELAGGGDLPARQLFRALGLRWGAESSDELAPRAPAGTRQEPQRDPTALHDLARPPATVAHQWRHSLSPTETERIEELTAPVRSALAAATRLEPTR